ncbi:MAG: hypothetical protein ABIQ18_22380 [Umezawaea sp.]
MTTTTAPPITPPDTTIDDDHAPSDKRRIGIGKVLAWTFTGLVIIASLFPFYWILRTWCFNVVMARQGRPSRLRRPVCRCGV